MISRSARKTEASESFPHVHSQQQLDQTIKPIQVIVAVVKFFSLVMVRCFKRARLASLVC